MDAADETNRLLATLIRMQCETQAQAILELHRAGIGSGRVAELLGTTANPVNVTVQRSKRQKAKTSSA